MSLPVDLVAYPGFAEQLMIGAEDFLEGGNQQSVAETEFFIVSI